MSKRLNVRALIMAIAVLATSTAAILHAHQVKTTVTSDDQRSIAIILEGIPRLTRDASYVEELLFIRRVQKRVLALSPIENGLPFKQAREPKDLLLAGSGLCYDRSRTIEKVLRSAGFHARHVSIYASSSERSELGTLLTPGADSHAITEVLTSHGWVAVDSNAPWLSLSDDGHPQSLSQISAGAKQEGSIAWLTPPPSLIYDAPFSYVYGLYSRHGNFYPPYDFIPDVNYAELLHNFL